MDRSYPRRRNIVSNLNYRFVFCSRYRRKIFDIPNAEAQFRKALSEVCSKLNINILERECAVDTVHLFLNCPIELNPTQVMSKIKAATGNAMINNIAELSKMPNVWTLNYYVSTDLVAKDIDIKEFIETQKRRYK
jgi:putative transposase